MFKKMRVIDSEEMSTESDKNTIIYLHIKQLVTKKLYFSHQLFKKRVIRDLTASGCLCKNDIHSRMHLWKTSTLEHI